MKVREFGKMPDQTVIDSIVMENKNGMQVEILSIGGVIRSIKLPEKDGGLTDIVLGFNCLEDYLENGPNFGAVIGRLVGPVPDCRLEYNGQVVLLPPSNAQGKHVHGGKKGFARSVWTVQMKVQEKNSLTLQYESTDGDDGYPGNIKATVTYVLGEENDLTVCYEAWADREVPFNPTNHSYFNLSGHNRGTIDRHRLWIFHDKAVTDGVPVPVAGSVLNFQTPTTIGERIQSQDPLMKGGLNHFHVLRGEGMRTVMSLEDQDSGRRMEIDTDCAGAVVYAGGNLNHVQGKDQAVYDSRSGLAFEPCFVRDQVPFNPSHVNLIGPSAPFRSITRYRFTNI